MKVTVPFAKNIWASLGITLATSVIDAEIQKTTWFRDNAFNNFKQGNERDNKNRSGILIFSWKEWVEQLKMKQKNKKKRIFKHFIIKFRSKLVKKQVSSKRNCKRQLWKKTGFWMPPHALTNFEIRKHYQFEPRFNGVYSRNNLPKKIKDGAYVLNNDQYVAVGTH